MGRNVKMYPSNTEKRPDMLMIRWDAPIFFANTASFKSRVKKHIGRFLENNSYPKPWCLCLCFSGVNDVDFTGLEMLEAFFTELQEKEHGMTLVLCKLKTQVLNALTKGCDFPALRAQRARAVGDPRGGEVVGPTTGDHGHRGL